MLFSDKFVLINTSYHNVSFGQDYPEFFKSLTLISEQALKSRYHSTSQNREYITDPAQVMEQIASRGKTLTLSMLIRARAARSIQAGEPVLEDDITDINEIEFQGVDIPKNAAVVCLLSFGWRKGLFFDFTPVASDEAEREYDLGKLLGSYSG